MEQALQPEDVLKCRLVLKHSHSSRLTGTELGCFQLAGSSHHNYQRHLELIVENSITWTKHSSLILSQTIRRPQITPDSEERGGKAAASAGAARSGSTSGSTSSRSIPDSLGRTRAGSVAELLRPLTTSAARGSRRMTCWNLIACCLTNWLATPLV